MVKKLGLVMLFMAACAISLNFSGCKPKKLPKEEVKKRTEKMEQFDKEGSGAGTAIE